jgi:hypothetical protein
MRLRHCINGLIGDPRDEPTSLTFSPSAETLRCTASVGISTYPGRHCSSTSLTTLSNASVQVVGVAGTISFSRACEHDRGWDMVEKVVKLLGVFRVWWRSD